MARYMTVSELAEELKTKPSTIREFARRKVDPLPLHRMPWNNSHGTAKEGEVDEWIERNWKEYA